MRQTPSLPQGEQTSSSHPLRSLATIGHDISKLTRDYRMDGKFIIRFPRSINSHSPTSGLMWVTCNSCEELTPKFTLESQLSGGDLMLDSEEIRRQLMSLDSQNKSTRPLEIASEYLDSEQ